MNSRPAYIHNLHDLSQIKNESKRLPNQTAISNKFKLTNNKLQPVKSSKLDLNNNTKVETNFPRFNPVNHSITTNPGSSSNSLLTPLLQNSHQGAIPSQLLLNQQTALAALTASINSNSNGSSSGGNSLMSLFSNPQLFMAMAAAASSMGTPTFNNNIHGNHSNSSGLTNGKKSATPVAGSSLAAMKFENFNNNN